MHRERVSFMPSTNVVTRFHFLQNIKNHMLRNYTASTRVFSTRVFLVMARFKVCKFSWRRVLERCIKNSSNPPYLSNVRRPRADTTKEIVLPRILLFSRTLCTFGKKKQLVLLFAWLTKFPLSAFLPVMTQHFDMVFSKNIFIYSNLYRPLNAIGGFF